MTKQGTEVRRGRSITALPRAPASRAGERAHPGDRRSIGQVDSTAWDERYRSSELIWGAGPNRFLVEEVAGLPAGRALDLACGEGRNAIWLAQRGWQVVAVDFSAVALDKARRLADQRGTSVEWAMADVTAWDPPGVYDLVLVMYLHLPAPARRAAFHRAGQAVGPQGTVLVVGHDLSNLTEGHGGPQDPSVLYGPADVVADIGAGFEIQRAERVQRPVEAAGSTVFAVDVLVRARRL